MLVFQFQFLDYSSSISVSRFQFFDFFLEGIFSICFWILVSLCEFLDLGFDFNFNCNITLNYRFKFLNFSLLISVFRFHYPSQFPDFKYSISVSLCQFLDCSFSILVCWLLISISTSSPISRFLLLRFSFSILVSLYVSFAISVSRFQFLDFNFNIIFVFNSIISIPISIPIFFGFSCNFNFNF